MKFSFLLFLLIPHFSFGGPEVRTWRALSGHTTEAALVSSADGMVQLKKVDGEVVSVPLSLLHPADQQEVRQIMAKRKSGRMPSLDEIPKPTGRREISFEKREGEALWPDSLSPKELEVVQSVGRDWEHAESRFFMIHYQSLAFARRVARMADFQYQYIASDLPGFMDRLPKKSHIIAVRDRDDWLEFLQRGGFPSWAAAFVRGDIMFLYDLNDSEQNASILAHEMSHLILNRFFVHHPPLWLNEGLAEWYGNMGHEAFKGQKVDPDRGLGELENPFPISTLLTMRGYPEDQHQIFRYYATVRQVVGMLMLSGEQEDFVRFLTGIVVEGNPFFEPLSDVYGYSSPEELERAFQEFLR